jgi:hypothetical protein
MSRATPLDDATVRRMRAAAQHLHRPRRRSVVELVRHLTGVQAQVLSAAGLALRARSTGLKAEQLDHARLRERSIVLTWAMRGTLHLIPAEDCGWLVPPVTEPSVSNSYRRLKQVGVPADQPAKALHLIAKMLESEGPLTRPEISARLRRKGIHTEGQAIAHFVWLAASQGTICYGPDRARAQCFVLVEDWLGTTKTMPREAALAELAIRYVTAHAPARPADLAYWSGIRIGDANRAWKAIADKIVEVATERGVRWSLRTNKPQAPRGIVRLLPAFDEYLLGWKDREVAVSSEDYDKVNRGGGWLHPVVLADGELVGTWRTARTSKKAKLEVAPFTQLSPAVNHGIAAEAKDIARFTDAPLELGS